MTSPLSQSYSPITSSTCSAIHKNDLSRKTRDVVPQSQLFYNSPFDLPNWTSPSCVSPGHTQAITNVSPIGTTSAFAPVLTKKCSGIGARNSYHLSHEVVEGASFLSDEDECAETSRLLTAKLPSLRQISSTTTSVTSRAELQTPKQALAHNSIPKIASFKCHEPLKLRDVFPSIEVQQVPISLVSYSDGSKHQPLFSTGGLCEGREVNSDMSHCHSTDATSEINHRKSMGASFQGRYVSEIECPTMHSGSVLSSHSDNSRTYSEVVSKPNTGLDLDNCTNLSNRSTSQFQSHNRSYVLSDKKLLDGLKASSIPEEPKECCIVECKKPRSTNLEIKSELVDASFLQSAGPLESPVFLEPGPENSGSVLQQQFSINVSKHIPCFQTNDARISLSSPLMSVGISHGKLNKRQQLFSTDRENVFQFSSSRRSSGNTEDITLSISAEQNTFEEGGASEHSSQLFTTSSNSQLPKLVPVNALRRVKVKSHREDLGLKLSSVSEFPRNSGDMCGVNSTKRLSLDSAIACRDSNLVSQHEQHTQKMPSPDAQTPRKQIVCDVKLLADKGSSRLSRGDRCEDCMTSGLRLNCTKCFRLKILGRSDSLCEGNSCEVGFLSSRADDNSLLATHPFRLSDDALKLHPGTNKFRDSLTKRFQGQEGLSNTPNILHGPPISCKNTAINGMLEVAQESDVEDELYEEDPIPNINPQVRSKQTIVLDSQSSIAQNFAELHVSNVEKSITQHNPSHWSGRQLKSVGGNVGYSNGPNLRTKSPQLDTGSIHPPVSLSDTVKIKSIWYDKNVDTIPTARQKSPTLSKEESDIDSRIKSNRSCLYNASSGNKGCTMETLARRQSWSSELYPYDKLAQYDDNISTTGVPSQLCIRELENDKKIVKSVSHPSSIAWSSASSRYGTGWANTQSMVSEGKYVVGGIQSICDKGQYRRSSCDDTISPTLLCEYQPMASRTPDLFSSSNLVPNSNLRENCVRSRNLWTTVSTCVTNSLSAGCEATSSAKSGAYQALAAPSKRSYNISDVRMTISTSQPCTPATELTTLAKIKEEDAVQQYFNHSNERVSSVINDLTPTASEQLQQILNSAQEFIRNEEILRTSKSLSSKYSPSSAQLHSNTNCLEPLEGSRQSSSNHYDNNCALSTREFTNKIDVIRAQRSSHAGLGSNSQSAGSILGELNAKLSQRYSPSISQLASQCGSQGSVGSTCSPNVSPSLRKTAVVAPYVSGIQGGNLLAHQVKTPTTSVSPTSRRSSPPSLTPMTTLPPAVLSSSPVHSGSPSVGPLSRHSNTLLVQPSKSNSCTRSSIPTQSCVTPAARVSTPSYRPTLSASPIHAVFPHTSVTSSIVYESSSPTLLTLSPTAGQDRSSTSSAWSDEVFESPSPSVTDEVVPLVDNVTSLRPTEQVLSFVASHLRPPSVTEHVLSNTTTARSQVNSNRQLLTEPNLCSNPELKENGKLSSLMTAQVFSGQPCQDTVMDSNKYIYSHHSKNTWDSGQRHLKKEASGYY